jgi:hypothetical protein
MGAGPVAPVPTVSSSDIGGELLGGSPAAILAGRAQTVQLRPDNPQ